MRVEVGKKTSKKWIITYFYDVTWQIFETICPSTHIIPNTSNLTIRAIHYERIDRQTDSKCGKASFKKSIKKKDRTV